MTGLTVRFVRQKMASQQYLIVRIQINKVHKQDMYETVGQQYLRQVGIF